MLLSCRVSEYGLYMPVFGKRIRILKEDGVVELLGYKDQIGSYIRGRAVEIVLIKSGNLEIIYVITYLKLQDITDLKGSTK